MPYRVPNFPLSVHIWRRPDYPGGLPSVETVCQMTASRRNFTLWFGSEALFSYTEQRFLLLPVGTDIRDGRGGDAAGDVVIVMPEVNAAPFYVVGVVDVAKGFSNEYRRATVVPTGSEWAGAYVIA